MKICVAICLLILGSIVGARTEKLVLVGGTAINPGDGKVIQNAVITIRRKH
jgi:hypothetical protein